MPAWSLEVPILIKNCIFKSSSYLTKGGKFFPPCKLSECCIDCQDGYSFSFHISPATIIFPITSPCQKKKTTLFVECLLVHVLHLGQNRQILFCPPHPPSFIVNNGVNTWDYHGSWHAQLFAIWKLQIFWLYNCKRGKKSIKRFRNFLFIPKTGRTEY